MATFALAYPDRADSVCTLTVRGRTTLLSSRGYSETHQYKYDKQQQLNHGIYSVLLRHLV